MYPNAFELTTNGPNIGPQTATSSRNSGNLTFPNKVISSGSVIDNENAFASRYLQLHPWTLNVRKQDFAMSVTNSEYKNLFEIGADNQFLKGHLFFTFDRNTIVDQAIVNNILGGRLMQSSVGDDKVIGAEWGKINEILKDGFQQQIELLDKSGFNIFQGNSQGTKFYKNTAGISHPDSYRSKNNSISMEVHVPVFEENSLSSIDHNHFFEYFYGNILEFNSLEIKNITGYILLDHFSILHNMVSDSKTTFDVNKFQKPIVQNFNKKSPLNAIKNNGGGNEEKDKTEAKLMKNKKEELLKYIPSEKDIYDAYKRRFFTCFLTQGDNIEQKCFEYQRHKNKILNNFMKLKTFEQEGRRDREHLINVRNLFYNALCDYFGAESFVRFCTLRGVVDTWHFFGSVEQGLESTPNTIIPGFGNSTLFNPVKNFGVYGRTRIINRWGQFLETGDNLYIIVKKLTSTSPFQLIPYHGRSSNSLLFKKKIETPFVNNQGDRLIGFGYEKSSQTINKNRIYIDKPPYYLQNYEDFDGTTNRGALLRVGQVAETYEDDCTDDVRAWSIAINPNNLDMPIANEYAMIQSKRIWNNRVTVTLKG